MAASVVDLTINIDPNTCRACLESYEKTLCLTDEIESNEINLVLWELLEVVSKVKCNWDHPNFPTQICQNCARRLIEAYEFIREVEKSQQTLEEMCSNLIEPPNIIDNDAGEIFHFGDTLLDLDEEVSVAYAEEEQQVATVNELPLAENKIGLDIVELETAEVVYAPEDKQLPEQDECATQHASESEEGSEPAPRPSQVGTRLDRSQKFKFKCTVCPRLFAKNESLKRHMTVAHSRIAKMAAQELANENKSNDTLTCQQCPRIFKRTDTLQRHMLACHPGMDMLSGNAAAATKASATPKRQAKRSECPYCGVSFTSSSLTIHIRRHTGEKPYECDVCDKAFPRSQDLSVHKRIHTGERPNQCAICSKAFISQNKLARHMRLHTGQRPYSCDICDRSFVQSNDLKIHLRRHTGERPYKCGVCGDGFISGALLNVHRNTKGHHERHKAADAVNDPYENCRVAKRRADDIERMRLKNECKEQASQLQHEPLSQRSCLPLPYKCGVCGGSFKTGASLTIHRNNKGHYEMS